MRVTKSANEDYLLDQTCYMLQYNMYWWINMNFLGDINIERDCVWLTLFYLF